MFGMRLVSAAICVAVFGAASANAYTLRDIGGPKEVPPASYTASQYVDSRGCLFARAGYGGAVTWVPRVAGNRKVICGQTPSLAGGTRVAAVAAPVIAAPKAAVRASAPAATYLPARVAVPAKSAPLGRQTIKIVSGQTDCPSLGLGRGYLLSDGRQIMQCGSQTGQSASYVVVSRGVKPAVSAPVVVIAAVAVQPIARGYKLAWTDGRLSTTRAQGTAEGAAQMALVWDDHVPRRLIDRNSGRVVTTSFPGLLYPYTDYATQEQAIATTRVAAAAKTPVKVAAKTTAGTAMTVAAAQVPGGRLSTSAALASPSHRYVQVGSFGVPENASGAAARLQALGLPVRMAQASLGGKAVQIVLAGPFDSADQVMAGLAAARQSGFGDAFARN